VIQHVYILASQSLVEGAWSFLSKQFTVEITSRLLVLLRHCICCEPFGFTEPITYDTSPPLDPTPHAATDSSRIRCSGPRNPHGPRWRGRPNPYRIRCSSNGSYYNGPLPGDARGQTGTVRCASPTRCRRRLSHRRTTSGAGRAALLRATWGKGSRS